MKRLLSRSVATSTFCGAMACLSFHASVHAETFAEAMAGGKAYADFRMRFESVEQDNARADAEALTLRSRIGYRTGDYGGLSAVIEFEDSRPVFGFENYSVDPVGINPNEYSVIADPEVTELDQAFIQYKAGSVTTRFGPQVITLDGHRFVGHVGWRQDRQTFDALTSTINASEELTVTLGYIFGRNRIFSDDLDQNSKDILANVAYNTPIGKVVTYAYLLEDDFGVNAERDTAGISLTGKSAVADDVSILYALEYATQSLENDSGDDFNTEYLFAELGVAVNVFTGKVGYEVLGSDDGLSGFATPLATLHKFNGWADQFLATPEEGLEDLYVSAEAKIGPGALTLVYHDFTADKPSASRDDLGSELNVSYTAKFGKHYNAGIKYADYSADDFSVDTKKFWLWVGMSI